jgi:glycogen debranching enzyme
MSSLENALQIAVHDLRSCYGRFGIKTGNLRDTYWSWDSFFASFGAVELGDYSIVKKNLATFLSFQNKEGIIPRRISAPFLFYHMNFLSRRLLKPGKGPSYSAAFLFRQPRFQNLAFIIAFSNYVRKTKDVEFLLQNYRKLRLAIDLIIRENPCLVSERHFENWSETVMKKGKVLFTNVLYYAALWEMSYLSHLISKENPYSGIAARIKRAINLNFWNGDYFIDFIDKERINNFSADGNVSAILFGVADKKQSLKIQEVISKTKLARPVPLRTNWPKYPSNLLFPINRLILKDYHNGHSWLWLGCLDSVAKHKVGLKEEARKQVEQIARIIDRDGTVSEVYDEKGRPLSTRLYKAEKRFAWSAGLFIWAANHVYSKNLLTALN